MHKLCIVNELANLVALIKINYENVIILICITLILICICGEYLQYNLAGPIVI